MPRIIRKDPMDILASMRNDHDSYVERTKASIESDNIETVRRAARYFLDLYKNEVSHSQNLDRLLDASMGTSSELALVVREMRQKSI